MIVEKNKVISLSYELKVEGETVETVGTDSPLMFLFGTDNLLPKFEENLNGLKLNDGFDFDLVTADAYGPVADDAIVDVPLQAFAVDGEIDHENLKVGNHIPMLDQSGKRLNGVVVKFNDEFVTMDFNHPLAGNNLHFSGKVVE
ncbi:MAG: peptidylprolyl isomerase, partial [Bacteroidales bacterium]